MAARDEILNELKAVLTHEAHLDMHESPLDIDLEDGVLLLSGEVEHIAAKKRAVELASGIEGVKEVRDLLTVKPASRMGDEEIRNHVRDLLLQEPELHFYAIRQQDAEGLREMRPMSGDLECYINVAVEDGIVTLEGQADSLARMRMAGVLAWWVPGTRAVRNRIAIVPTEEDNDLEVGDNLLRILEKDPYVDATQIQVRVQDHVVTLSGAVIGPRERDMAESDAWFMPGVKNVINQIQVNP